MNERIGGSDSIPSVHGLEAVYKTSPQLTGDSPQAKLEVVKLALG